MKCQLEQRDKVSLERLQRDAGWGELGDNGACTSGQGLPGQLARPGPNEA
jgi:hypothetical protein